MKQFWAAMLVLLIGCTAPVVVVHGLLLADLRQVDAKANARLNNLEFLACHQQELLELLLRENEAHKRDLRDLKLDRTAILLTLEILQDRLPKAP